MIPDDIKQVAVPALAHRITLRPELWVRQVSADDVVAAAAGQRADPDGPTRPPLRALTAPGPAPSPGDRR